MSKQREVVYQAVMSSCDHPSAELVLARAKIVMPSINLATVYRNLNALISEGRIKKISADGGDRFDKTLKDHAHFQCNKCGAVVDVMGVDFSNLSGNSFYKENQIDNVEVAFKGVCKDCLKVRP